MRTSHRAFVESRLAPPVSLVDTPALESGAPYGGCESSQGGLDGIADRRHERALSGRPRPRGVLENLRDGSSRSPSSPTRSCSPPGVDAEPAARPALRQGARRARRTSTSSTPAFFGYQPARGRDDGSRSTGSSWSAPGRRSRTPATTRRRTPARIGVFAGASVSTLPAAQPAAEPRAGAAVGDRSRSRIGNDKDFLATRVSYKLDLRGPASTCRPPARPRWWPCTLACQSLLDLRVRHGAGRRRRRSRLPQAPGYLHQEGASARPTGTAAPSTPAPRARSAATAWAWWC